MYLALILCSAALCVDGDMPAASPSAADLAAYREARSKAGREPDAQVRLALWCEAHGLSAERVRHLAAAVMADPAHAMARGLMGLVPYRGQWERPDAVGDRVRADAELAAKLAEYNGRRGRTANTADAHWRLALWCEGAGLAPEAEAHLTNVIRLDPSRDAAWKRLGYKHRDGGWATDAQVAAAKAEAEARRKADRKWRPILAKWHGMLADKSPTKRAEAEAGLATVDDPRAVAAVLAVFGSERGPDQSVAARVLGQIDGPAASRALAGLAIFAATPEARRVATETLRRRDPRDFLGLLVGLVRDPIKYEVKPVDGPGSTGVLFVEGERFNTRRTYAPPPLPDVVIPPGSTVSYDADGQAVINRYFPMYRPQGFPPAATPLGPAGSPHGAGKFAGGAMDGMSHGLPYPMEGSRQVNPGHNAQLGVGEALTPLGVMKNDPLPVDRMVSDFQRGATSAQQQMNADIASIEAVNASSRRTNDRVLAILRPLTGEDRPADRKSWDAWWIDQQGYAYIPRPAAPVPTVDFFVPLNYIPPNPGYSCFAAGTMVRTLDGPRPIEAIRAGDRVLAQDPKSGSLDFRPVLAAFHNKPSQTLRVTLGGDSIVATGIHRFWKAGHGWTMARDLVSGDPIRVVGGTARVAKVEPERVQPVFNLEVSEGHSFFVGTVGALVHDNSLVRPTPEPFDAAPALAVSARD